MTVFDTFMFCDEYDMLECRLRELADTPVQHIIVEGTTTHRGPPKPLNFPDHRERYAAWADRITYFPVENLPQRAPWRDRINLQRECTGDALRALGAQPDDIVIMSDIDEIITPEGVEVAARGEHVCFYQRHSVFCADWVAPKLWAGPSSAKVKDVGSFAEFRLSGMPVTSGAGTHLSWLGGPDAVRAKMGRYGHSEMDAEMLIKLDNGSYLLRGDTWEGQCTAEEVDETWPDWVFTRECPPEWFRAYWQPKFTWHRGAV